MALRLLVVDNYDSFTWNLVQGLGAAGAVVDVVTNDTEPLSALLARAVDGIVLSPGPGTPMDAGVTLDLVRGAAGRVPLLGICLGHQAIGVAFGARLVPARRVVHGKTSSVRHGGTGLCRVLGQPFQAMRYHSLALDAATLPPDLECTAWTDDGEVMAVRHRWLAIEGLQFHPESIGTDDGQKLLEAYVARVAEARGHRSAA